MSYCMRGGTSKAEGSKVDETLPAGPTPLTGALRSSVEASVVMPRTV